MTRAAENSQEQPASNIGRMLKIDQVVDETSLSRSAIYRAIAAGTFPKGRQIGPKRVAWPQRDIDAWKEGRFPFPN
jgi:prophage regulatory protein